MRVGIISCSATKLDQPAPAHELYQGQLFKLAKQYIVRSVVVGACNVGERNEWGILSALHGLVLPDQVVEPYDFSLHDMTASERREWEEMVYCQLVDQWGTGPIYTVLTGQGYKAPVQRMPMYEDPIAYWTECRRERGMTRRRAAMGIGLIKRELKQQVTRKNWMREEVVEEAIKTGGYTFERGHPPTRL